MHEKLVLVVEDDDSSYILMKVYLEMCGHKAIRSSTGINAIDICKTNRNIFLVLLDIRLPDMNGIDVCRFIKKFRPDLDIIFQSANVNPIIKEYCLEVGGKSFLSKPISYTDLLQCITY